MNLFKVIFGSLFVFLKKVFTGQTLEKAIETAKQISEITAFALPIVALVAAATPNKLDDLVAAGAAAINTSLKEILEETDKNKRSGLVLALAAASIKIFFKQKIEAGESVSIAGKKISTLAELDAIDEDFFRSAAQSGFTLWRHSGKPALT